MAVKKITKRWLFNNLGVILVILIALEVIFAFGIREFYYSSVRSTILAQSSVITSQLTSYAEDSSAVFASQVRTLVENFQERERMELMAIDINGKVTFTSSGFEPGNEVYMPDFTEALRSNSGTAEMVDVVNGEKIMAITVISPVVGEQLAAMRIAVSLDRIDQQIILFILVITLVCVAILFFVIFSSSYFINSIVNPVGEIGATARKIAQGDFGARLHKKNDDEIGELCDTINYMAEELSANERMKNDFISSVSHELRTPLTAIKGWAETLNDMHEEIDRETLGKGMRVINGDTDQRLPARIQNQSEDPEQNYRQRSCSALFLPYRKSAADHGRNSQRKVPSDDFRACKRKKHPYDHGQKTPCICPAMDTAQLSAQDCEHSQHHQRFLSPVQKKRHEKKYQVLQYIVQDNLDPVRDQKHLLRGMISSFGAFSGKPCGQFMCVILHALFSLRHLSVIYHIFRSFSAFLHERSDFVHERSKISET